MQELKGKLDFSKRHNNVADSRFSKVSNECDSLNSEIRSGGVCGGERVQRLMNATNVVDATIEGLNRDGAHARKLVCDTTCNKSVASGSVFTRYSSRTFQCYIIQWVIRLSMVSRVCLMILVIVSRLCENA